MLEQYKFKNIEVSKFTVIHDFPKVGTMDKNLPKGSDQKG